MQQFNPVDAALLYMESPTTPFHVSFVNIYDPSTCPNGPPTFDDIQEAIRRCLPGAPAFRRKIVRVPYDIDHPYWIEDENFDLDFHMRHLALPRPGNWRQFREQVSRLISRPLDLTRSPWEMTVIEGLDAIENLPPGCFCTVLKIHHCAIDGQAGVALLNLISQDSPDKEPVELEDDWEPEEVPGTATLLGKSWLKSIRRPTQVARYLMSHSSDLINAALEDIDHDREDEEEEHVEVPRTILEGRVSAHRIYDEVTCSLADIKAVRSAVEGATINDVCLVVVAECMRRYLLARDALPEQPLQTMVPIAIRTPEEAKAGGNQISMTRVSLRTDIADPLERLAAITEETRRKKAMQDGVMMKTILDVVYNLPGNLVGLVGRATPLLSASMEKSGSPSNTMVTNVPGPRHPLYFLGAKMVGAAGCPPLIDGGGVLHAITSFEDRVIFSFTACKKLLKDADFYRECLEDSIAAVTAAGEKPRAAKKPARKSTPRKRPAKSTRQK